MVAFTPKVSAPHFNDEPLLLQLALTLNTLDLSMIEQGETAPLVLEDFF